MITILTPTYNRAHTLPRLYESLCAQTSKDFEWIIIDDGSDDGTRSLVEEFSLNADFLVRYLWQVNAGKHVAVNSGVELSTGDWVFIVDSDDALTLDAIEVVNKTISVQSLDKAVGLCFRKAYFDQVIVGEIVDKAGHVVMTPSRAGHLVKGDLAYIFKTSAMKMVPFPVIQGEKFVPELYVWNKISDLGFVYFFLNKFIYFCEYLDDGYSKNFRANLRNNPKGFLRFYQAQFLREPFFYGKIKCVIRGFQCCLYIFKKSFS